MRRFTLLSIALLLASCSFIVGIPKGIDSTLDETTVDEDFDEADRPSFDVKTVDGEYTYKLLPPWNYDKSWNAHRAYPLVVSLHGATSSTSSYYAPCIVGDDDAMQAHPCFFMAPNSTSGWGDSADWVRDEIERLISQYRINENRIYLMGFSMGGSGSYQFANLDYDDYGRLFAAIVRLAGQSQTEVRDAIADKTSIWYHIGLSDTAERVTIAEEAYQFIKSYKGNAKAKESAASDTVGSYARTTKTLVKDGVEIMKKSEYEGMGHDGSTPFKDSGVLEWMFSQSLTKR